jgi:hypothetical protein
MGSGKPVGSFILVLLLQSKAQRGPRVWAVEPLRRSALPTSPSHLCELSPLDPERHGDFQRFQTKDPSR